MSRKSEVLPAANYFLKPGYILVANRPTVISTVLGSCVAVCLYDRKRKVGGMNHFMSPFISEPGRATARYGNVSTLALIGMMIKDGSKVRNLEAQIFGGAFNRGVSNRDVGRENVRVARRILARKKIKLVSEDVGGEKGRKIIYNTSTNDVAVMKVDRLRRGDWHPYLDDR